jgi:hypothetical protein
MMFECGDPGGRPDPGIRQDGDDARFQPLVGAAEDGDAGEQDEDTEGLLDPVDALQDPAARGVEAAPRGVGDGDQRDGGADPEQAENDAAAHGAALAGDLRLFRGAFVDDHGRLGAAPNFERNSRSLS